MRDLYKMGSEIMKALHRGTLGRSCAHNRVDGWRSGADGGKMTRGYVDIK